MATSTYFVGGGVAAFDCDDDGRPDLYVAGGTPTGRPLPQPERDRRQPAVHADSPIQSTDLTSVTGAYPLDIDGDGVIDLAVLRHGENVLLRGTGDCRFERANEAWAFDGGRRMDDSLQRDLGSGLDLADAGHRQLPR